MKKQTELLRKKYYVYKFLNKNNVVVYVGKTTDLYYCILTHRYLDDQVTTIKYIECKSEAEMIWKKIYYTNLYYNSLSKNINDVYQGGQIEDINLADNWKPYFIGNKILCDDMYIIEHYNKYVINVPPYNYKSLIHILEHKKLNNIGKDKYSLSQKWFATHKDDGIVDQLRKNVCNYFRNLVPCCKENSLNNNLWTTYLEFKNFIKGKGYTKAFVAVNSLPNNDYTNRVYLAYLANSFYPVGKQADFQISEEQYALMELLQFMFQSALSINKEIWIYIPSSRMRNLLTQWIDNKNNIVL